MQLMKCLHKASRCTGDGGLEEAQLTDGHIFGERTGAVSGGHAMEDTVTFHPQNGSKAMVMSHALTNMTSLIARSGTAAVANLPWSTRWLIYMADSVVKGVVVLHG